MNQLQLCKLFAELEGVSETSFELDYITEECGHYNPITDLALTMKAMIDYKVQKTTSMVNHGVTIISIRGGVAIKISDDAETPSAIIECILKSEGKL